MTYLLRTMTGLSAAALLIVLMVFLLAIAPSFLIEFWFLTDFIGKDWNSSSHGIEYIQKILVSLWMIVGSLYIGSAAIYRLLRVTSGKTWTIALDSGRISYFPAARRFVIGSMLYFGGATAILKVLV